MDSKSKCKSQDDKIFLVEINIFNVHLDALVVFELKENSSIS